MSQGVGTLLIGVFMIVFLNMDVFSQEVDTSINSLNGVYSGKDCDFSFKVSCSAFLLKNGKYKCWFATDLSKESLKGKYRVDWENKKVIFLSSSRGEKSINLIHDSDAWQMERYKKDVRNRCWFLREYWRRSR